MFPRTVKRSSRGKYQACRDRYSRPSLESLETRLVPSELDLQVVSISRSPEYPRFDPVYQVREVTEPSGFGPYLFSASTGLGDDQTFDTQRWPHPGDPVTFTATVRNRGTEIFSGNLPITWNLDGATVSAAAQTVYLQPGETARFSYTLSWDQEPHDLAFQLKIHDA